MKLYIAGPMFSQAELEFNEKLAETLEKNGLNVFLPQRDGLKMSELLKSMTTKEASCLIFETDILNIRSCDAFLFVLDGRVPDEGACVALGYAYSQNVPCYGLKTDPRSAISGEINPMLRGSIQKEFTTIEETASFFRNRKGE